MVSEGESTTFIWGTRKQVHRHGKGAASERFHIETIIIRVVGRGGVRGPRKLSNWEWHGLFKPQSLPPVTHLLQQAYSV